MSEKRQQLLNRIIAIYGYEHATTIWFAELCENWDDNEWNDTLLELFVKSHEMNPIEGDE